MREDPRYLTWSELNDAIDKEMAKHPEGSPWADDLIDELEAR